MRLRSALAFAAPFLIAGVAEACPDWTLEPSFGEVNLSEGFQPDPHEVAVTAGGSFSLMECGLGVTGFVAGPPDFDLYYATTGAYPLTITVQSAVDTVLLIRGPDGRYYFDDDGGAQLGIGQGGVLFFRPPAPGLYDIWVGTFARGGSAAATLVITELLD